MATSNRFLILENIKKYIISLEKIIVTFPRKDIITRNMIYNDSLMVLELVCKANYESNKDLKKQYQIEALAKIKKQDFYLERAYKLKYISEKTCNVKSNELLRINKMIYGWWQNDA